MFPEKISYKFCLILRNPFKAAPFLLSLHTVLESQAVFPIKSKIYIFEIRNYKLSFSDMLFYSVYNLLSIHSVLFRTPSSKDAPYGFQPLNFVFFYVWFFFFFVLYNTFRSLIFFVCVIMMVMLPLSGRQ